jgi:hypothetical protein
MAKPSLWAPWGDARGGDNDSMTSTIRTVSVLILAAAALTLAAASDSLAAAPGAQAARFNDWRIYSNGPSGDRVTPGSGYWLLNRTVNRRIKYGSRTFGINLKWAAPGPNIHLKRKSGSGTLRYDEPVAIWVAGGGYLRYARRFYGINLGWSATPKYEWRFSNRTGVVNTGESLSIYNRVADAVLVYGERSVGINLIWRAGGGQPAERAADLVHTYRIGPFEDTASEPCTGTVTWTLTPERLTGRTGRATALTSTQSYSVRPTAAGPGVAYCLVQGTTGGLRAGRWHVRVRTPLWDTSCSSDLRGGWNVLTFTLREPGCSQYR